MHQAYAGIRLTLRVLLAVMLVALPIAAQALGLGKLAVKSGLDEPFNGQIDLIAPTALEIKTLKASLASRADFDIAGVERIPLLLDITYTVKQQSNGKYFLQLSTYNPVREPFLHFLIQVDWSGGHLIREYSALLDPPQWVAGTAAEVDVPVTSAPEAAPVVEVPPAVAVVPEIPPIAAAAPTEELPPIGTEQQAPSAAPVTSSPVATEPVVVPEVEAVAPVAQGAATSQGTSTQSTSTVEPAESAAIVEPITPTAAMTETEPAPAVVSGVTSAPVAEVPAVAGVSAATREYGPIKSGETLSIVASKVNSDKELTSQQVMLALLHANPSAFFGNNVNNLKTGKILTVPERETIAAIPKVQAAKEFRAQYDAWQEYKLKFAGATRAVAVAETETTAPAAEPKKAETKKPEKATKPIKASKEKPATGKAVPVDLLKIVRANLDQESTEETTKTPGVETKKDTGKEQHALNERVATLEEAIESKQMQNKDMRERVGKLQEQVKNTERLVELENKDLALSQKQAAEAKLAAEKAAAEKAAAEKAAQEKAAQEQAAKDKAAADAAKAAQAAKPVPEVVPAKKPVVAARPAPPAPPEEGFLSSFIASLSDNPLTLTLLAGLGVLVAGVGGMYAYRRRRASREFTESILSSSSLSSEASLSDTSGQVAASDTSFLSDFSQGGMGNIHTDEVDPIAEAEVYLAYGRDEQAEEILKDAIVKDPARQELKGKLLEIYFQRNDVAAFETLAEELYAALEGKGGKVWEKVEEMGQKLSPMNPMFRGGKPPEARAAVAPTTMVVGESAAPAAPGGENEFETMLSTQGLESGQGAAGAPASVDFNLDFESKAPTTSGARAEPAFDMSFDLDTGAKSAPASDSGSSFDMDFNIGTPEAADATSNLIDFKATETAATDFDFSASDSSTTPSADVEFSLGGMGESVTELETASESAAAEGSLPGWDETATKLDLAKAYIDMGDTEGARSILDEVMAEGNDSQKQQARNLAAQIAA